MTGDTASIVEIDYQQTIAVIRGSDCNVYIGDAKMKAFCEVDFGQISIFGSKLKNEFTTVYIRNLLNSNKIYYEFTIVYTFRNLIDYSTGVTTLELASGRAAIAAYGISIIARKHK